MRAATCLALIFLMVSPWHVVTATPPRVDWPDVSVVARAIELGDTATVVGSIHATTGSGANLSLTLFANGHPVGDPIQVAVAPGGSSEFSFQWRPDESGLIPLEVHAGTLRWETTLLVLPPIPKSAAFRLTNVSWVIEPDQYPRARFDVVNERSETAGAYVYVLANRSSHDLHPVTSVALHSGERTVVFVPGDLGRPITIYLSTGEWIEADALPTTDGGFLTLATPDVSVPASRDPTPHGERTVPNSGILGAIILALVAVIRRARP